MKFAHFSHIWGKPSMTPHQRYEELWRELELCDELDFDYAFCVEHHFRPDESWMSSPSLYAVGAGARTRRLRIGPMGYIVPLYQSQGKQFSTQFNFGDHIGVGRVYGEHRQNELMLRVQHFSNAGIARPNPGENFVQLRFVHRLE